MLRSFASSLTTPLSPKLMEKGVHVFELKFRPIVRLFHEWGKESSLFGGNVHLEDKCERNKKILVSFFGELLSLRLCFKKL